MAIAALAASPSVAGAATPPPFLIGVWSQPSSSFATWSSRGVNTVFGYNDSGGTVSFSAWNNALAQQNLLSIRPPEQSLSLENTDPRLLALSQPVAPNNWTSYLSPQTIQQNYANLKQGAPNKPVFLLLQGEDILAQPNAATYQAYAQGADWLSDGIYPINDGQGGYENDLLKTSAPVPGTIIDDLRNWSGGAKPLYQLIEAANLSGSTSSRGPNTWELRGEIWDSVIHGANGIVYVPQSGSTDNGTTSDIQGEITREDQLLAQYGSILGTPGTRISGLPSSFEGASHAYNGSTYTFVLNYSYSAASYQGVDYAPFEVGIFVDGVLTTLVGDTTQSATPNAPAFLIGVWSQPASLFPTWRKRGINTIVGYQADPTVFPSVDGSKFTAWDAELGEQGLFTIRVPARSSLALENSDPRLLAIAQPDEPDINGVPGATLLQNYTQYHTGAPSKPVLLDFSGGTIYTKYPTNQATYIADSPAGDWISNDIYPVSGWNRPDWIDLLQTPMILGAAPGGIDDNLRSFNPGKPEYNYIESSNQCLIYCWRAPTPDEMRGEIWDSVVHGARGIWYFPQQVDYGFQFDATPPNLVSEMTRQNARLSQYGPMLVAHGGPLNLAKPLEGAWRHWNGHYYYIVLDYSHSPTTYQGISMNPYTLLIFRDDAGSTPILTDGPAVATSAELTGTSKASSPPSGPSPRGHHRSVCPRVSSSHSVVPGCRAALRSSSRRRRSRTHKSR